MPGNETTNTGGEQQPQAGERAAPVAPLQPAPPDQVTPHKLAVLQLIVDHCEYRKVTLHTKRHIPMTKKTYFQCCEADYRI
jgi:hypothetical protein